MTAPISVNSELKLAIQSAKDIPATTDFKSPRLQQSNMFPTFDYVEPGPEHYCGADDRPIGIKDDAYRSGYVLPFGGRGRLYPESIGYMLRIAGFDAISTPGAATDVSHAFTIAERDDCAWGTVLYKIGDDADAYTVRGTNARAQSIMIDSSMQGVTWSFMGFGLIEGDADGGETCTADEDVPLVPTAGQFSATVGGSVITSKVLSSRLQINNPMATNEQPLFSGLNRSDLPQLGIVVSGMLGGIDVSEDIYDRLIRGGVGGTSPVATIPEMVLSYTFESAEVIPGCSVPYSFKLDIPACEARLQPFGSAGANLIRCNIRWRMKFDPGQQPVTLTVVNEEATH